MSLRDGDNGCYVCFDGRRGGDEGVTPRSGAPGEGEERGGEDGEASVEVVKFMIDVEESLFEAKDKLHNIAERLMWNYMRYVITSLEAVLHAE